MANLYLMIGIPGSGKTTFVENRAFEVFEPGVHVSRDDIRFSLVREDEPYFSKEKQVFNTFVQEIKDNLREGTTVYADATFLTEGSRVKLLNRIPDELYDNLIAIVAEVPLKVALERNSKRYGRTRVPEDDIIGMKKKMEFPFETYFNKVFTFDEKGTVIYWE